MTLRYGIPFFVLVLFVGCQQPSVERRPNIMEGMVKMAIYYPSGEGKTFDMDYYSEKHMPMAADLLGTSLKAMVIDEGIANGAPDAEVPYLAVGYFYFDDMTSFQTAMGPVSDQLRADVPNYTNIKPVVQISKVQTIQ